MSGDLIEFEQRVVGQDIRQQVIKPFDPVGAQNLTTTYADVDGSDHDFTPVTPVGAGLIVYEFGYQHALDPLTNSSHSLKLLVDGILESGSECSIGTNIGFIQGVIFYSHIVPSWGQTEKTIKLQAREFSAIFPVKLHETFFIDGITLSLVHQAVLKITEYDLV